MPDQAQHTKAANLQRRAAGEIDSPKSELASSLSPPAFNLNSAPNIVQMAPRDKKAPKTGGESADEATISSAVVWSKTSGPDSDATKSLQTKLGIVVSGEYDENTARAVFEKQKESKSKKPNGRANATFFRRQGLIFTQKKDAAVIDESIKSELLDELGEFKPEFSEGYTLGFYVDYKKRSGNNKEFLNQAGPWAKRHRALGIKDGKLTIGEPIMLEDTSQIIENVASIVEAIDGLWKKTKAAEESQRTSDLITSVEKIEVADSFFSEQFNQLKKGMLNGLSKYKVQQEGSKPKVKNLALFAHGMSFGVNTDDNKQDDYRYGLLAHDYKNDAYSNVEDFSNRISGYLSSDARVQLFSCNAGREFNADNPYEKSKGSHWSIDAEGADNSFASALSDHLGEDRSVYTHLTAGHTTRNPAAIVFGKDAEGETSKHMFDILYPPSFIDAQLDSNFPGIPEENREKAKGLLIQAMAIHYKGKYRYVDTGKKDDKGEAIKKKETLHKSVISKNLDAPGHKKDTNIGAEMFTDPEGTRTLVQADWNDSFIGSKYYKLYAKKITKLIPAKE